MRRTTPSLARRAALATASLFTMAALAATPARAGAPDPDAESDRLFYEGNELIAQGKTAEACERFEQSLALRRRGGTLLNLALCREAQGALSRALPLFEEARAIAERDGRSAREETARQHIRDLRAKVAWLTFTVATPAGHAPSDAEIELDGEAVPRDRWGVDLPVMPGKHVVIARAPGKRSVETSVVITRPGESHRVEIPALADEPAPAPPPSPRPPDRPPPESLSHARQLGGFVRLDVDPLHLGARAAVGVTIGVGDLAVVGAAVLLGRYVGVEPQITLFLAGTGHLKPYLNAATPVFFDRGDHAGVRLSLGLQVDVNRHLGLFGQVGGAYFPSVPADTVQEVFLPAAGVEGRF